MGDEHEGGDGPLAAGDFASWVGEMQGAIRGENESRVPCAGCTACCTSSQFVHIEPDETDTLAHIPAELLFPTPHRPRGHVLLGYDERGHCPMLVDNACSIYEHRPRTCRVYDCRMRRLARCSRPSFTTCSCGPTRLDRTLTMLDTSNDEWFTVS